MRIELPHECKGLDKLGAGECPAMATMSDAASCTCVFQEAMSYSCRLFVQMEKQDKTAIANDHLNRCRKILQQGLVANPDSAKLCQVPVALIKHMQFSSMRVATCSVGLWPSLVL